MKLFLIFFSISFVAKLTFAHERKLRGAVDIYLNQSNIMPFKGYQNDISATFHLKHTDYLVQPFARSVTSNYYYLEEGAMTSGDHTSDRRTSAGLGLDIIFSPFLKIRAVSDYVTNKLSEQSYYQDSYGLIYNQYIDLNFFELNNYLEVFFIPRVSTTKPDSFLKIQALKSFYVFRSVNSSNALFPFAEVKIKANDESNFGVSGHLASVGFGYRYVRDIQTQSNFSFLLEAHSLIYQSRDFNSDWVQALAAMQFMYN